MKPHGTYTIGLVEKVLMVDAVGPFNDDAVKEYSRDLNDFIEKLSPNPWALCAIFTNESLFTPEAEAALTAVTQWRKEKGMNLVTIVFNDIKELTILQSQMERIYKTANIQHAFFNKKNDAVSWLTKKGYISG